MLHKRYIKLITLQAHNSSKIYVHNLLHDFQCNIKTVVSDK